MKSSDMGETKEEDNSGNADNKTEGSSDAKSKENPEDEEDTTFCRYCKISFKSSDVYWRHTRGMLHTQKLMMASDVGPETSSQQTKSEDHAPKESDKNSEAKNPNQVPSTSDEKSEQKGTSADNTSEETSKTVENEGEKKKTKTATAASKHVSNDDKKFLEMSWLNWKNIPVTDDVENESRTEIYCESCGIRCTGPKNFRMHLEGQKHRQTIESSIKGIVKKKLPVPDRPAFGQRSLMITKLVKSTTDPLIGLEYITEFQKSDPRAAPRYYCNLCESKCDFNTVMPHITGGKHRLKTLKENHNGLYYNITKNSSKQRRSELGSSLVEMAQKVQDEYGSGHVKLKLEVEKDVPVGTGFTAGLKAKNWSIQGLSKAEPSTFGLESNLTFGAEFGSSSGQFGTTFKGSVGSFLNDYGSTSVQGQFGKPSVRGRGANRSYGDQYNSMFGGHENKRPGLDGNKFSSGIGRGRGKRSDNFLGSQGDILHQGQGLKKEFNRFPGQYENTFDRLSHVENISSRGLGRGQEGDYNSSLGDHEHFTGSGLAGGPGRRPESTLSPYESMSRRGLDSGLDGKYGSSQGRHDGAFNRGLERGLREEPADSFDRYEDTFDGGHTVGSFRDEYYNPSDQDQYDNSLIRDGVTSSNDYESGRGLTRGVTGSNDYESGHGLTRGVTGSNDYESGRGLTRGVTGSNNYESGRGLTHGMRGIDDYENDNDYESGRGLTRGMRGSDDFESGCGLTRGMRGINDYERGRGLTHGMRGIDDYDNDYESGRGLTRGMRSSDDFESGRGLTREDWNRGHGQPEMDFPIREDYEVIDESLSNRRFDDFDMQRRDIPFLRTEINDPVHEKNIEDSILNPIEQERLQRMSHLVKRGGFHDREEPETFKKQTESMGHFSLPPHMVETDRVPPFMPRSDRQEPSMPETKRYRSILKPSGSLPSREITDEKYNEIRQGQVDPSRGLTDRVRFKDQGRQEKLMDGPTIKENRPEFKRGESGPSEHAGGSQYKKPDEGHAPQNVDQTQQGSMNPLPRAGKTESEENSDNETNIHKALEVLSQSLISSEEDASVALEVSNALTQALLQYRLKNVPPQLQKMCQGKNPHKKMKTSDSANLNSSKNQQSQNRPVSSAQAMSMSQTPVDQRLISGGPNSAQHQGPPHVHQQMPQQQSQHSLNPDRQPNTFQGKNWKNQPSQELKPMPVELQKGIPKMVEMSLLGPRPAQGLQQMQHQGSIPAQGLQQMQHQGSMPAQGLQQMQLQGSMPAQGLGQMQHQGSMPAQGLGQMQLQGYAPVPLQNQEIRPASMQMHRQIRPVRPKVSLMHEGVRGPVPRSVGPIQGRIGRGLRPRGLGPMPRGKFSKPYSK